MIMLMLMLILILILILMDDLYMVHNTRCQQKTLIL
jgi:hypothetical protein